MSEAVQVHEEPARERIGPLGRIALAVLRQSLGRMREGALELRLPGGTAWRFGDPAAEAIELRVSDARFLRRLATGGKLALGEGYQAGEWTASDLPGLFRLFIRNEGPVLREGTLGALNRLVALRPTIELPRGLRRSEQDIHAHYDLGNEFFALWLDESLTYSSAFYADPASSLADAQQAKYRRLAEATRVGPDDHVLEIGSGWGGNAIHLARERGCRVTTITISREQHDEASRRVAEAGLSDRVDVRYQDYRTLEGSFSRVVSIEMIEAIGHRQFPTYFGTIDRVLAPGGLVGVQAILIPDQHYERYRRRPDWIRKHIFPGGLLPSIEVLARTARSASQLMIHEVFELGPHYSRTLREWRERFLEQRGEVAALGLDERFQRTWEYYLAFCEAAFGEHALRDVQIVLTRPGNPLLRG